MVKNWTIGVQTQGKPNRNLIENTLFNLGHKGKLHRPDKGREAIPEKAKKSDSLTYLKTSVHLDFRNWD